jgi:hypothetical protein
MLDGTRLLGIYTTAAPRNMVAKVQPSWLTFQLHDETRFIKVSDNYFEEKMFKGDTYYLAIHRYAEDEVYPDVLSKCRESFLPHTKQSSLKILKYLKGEVGRVKVDREYNFAPQLRFLRKKRKLNKSQRKALAKAGLCGTMIIKGGAGTGKTLVASLMIIEFLLVGRSALMTAVTETGAKQLAVRFIEELSCYQEQEGLLHIMDQLERIRNISRLGIAHEDKVTLIGQIEEGLTPLMRRYEEGSKKFRPLFFNSLVSQD